jgi:hypothetical protein
MGTLLLIILILLLIFAVNPCRRVNRPSNRNWAWVTNVVVMAIVGVVSPVTLCKRGLTCCD